MGGYSSEYKVSIRSGNEVYNNLNSSKYNLFRVIVTKENWCCIDKNENKHTINIKDFSVHKPKINFAIVGILNHSSHNDVPPSSIGTKLCGIGIFTGTKP